MQLVMAFVIAVMFGCSVYLILQKSFIKMLFGFALLNHAGNLLVLLMAGNPIGKKAPIVGSLLGNYVDPIPQALILTAIVIGFGMTAYFIVFLYRLFMDSQTTNSEKVFQDDNQ